MKPVYIITLLSLLISACEEKLPTKRYAQFEMEIERQLTPDSIRIYLANPLLCPLRIYGSSKDAQVDRLISPHFPLLLAPQQDSTLIFLAEGNDRFSDKAYIRISSIFGDPNRVLDPDPISLPFLSGRAYEVIQGYNGNFSHNNDYSRYALDLDMKIGDTVTAAAEGVVVGVIKDYQRGGNHRKWRDFANYITLFHPKRGIFTQYVHLKHEGSLVAVGDAVRQGQPIGLAGMTGFTSVEHLHFNVLKPTPEGMVSMPINFIEGYRGKNLKQNDILRKDARILEPAL